MANPDDTIHWPKHTPDPMPVHRPIAVEPAKVVISCPKCGSIDCVKTYDTPYSIGCRVCAHVWDSRGGFWQRIKRLFGISD